MFWDEYRASQSVVTYVALSQKTPYDPQGQTANSRTEADENLFKRLEEILQVGFCIAGHVRADRMPYALAHLGGLSS